MTLSEVDIKGALARAKEMAASDRSLPSSVRAVLELLVLIIELLLRRGNINSRNSSVPPSQDPYRKKSAGKVVCGERKRKPGGQSGHKGETIERIAKPDQVEELAIDRRTLPHGHDYRRVEDEIRQVINISITRIVIEYRAEVVEDENGRQYRAEFPQGVTRPVQYGASVKAEAVYLSGYQLLPLNRVQEFFRDQAGIELSAGTLHNFRKEAYERLADFEKVARSQLSAAPIGHFDETGVNIAGKLAWMHSASNALWTLYGVHEKRGKEGIDALGVLPAFSGIACHDHWKPYFKYNCLHALCNAHHTRELNGVIDNEGYTWAHDMKRLMERIHAAVAAAGGALSPKAQAAYRRQYRKILARGKKECPRNKATPHRRGRTRQSKPTNLLDRLRDYEDETLRFISNPIVPFSNNQAERDIRMTKLQQKTSGCFRSFEGANIFARIRSYLSTCQKHGLSATAALSSLFDQKLPEFIRESAE